MHGQGLGAHEKCEGASAAEPPSQYYTAQLPSAGKPFGRAVLHSGRLSLIPD